MMARRSSLGVLAMVPVVTVVVAVAAACGTAAQSASPALASGDARSDAEVDAGACTLVGSLGATCDPCATAHCCAEFHACFSGPECIDLNDCIATCDESVTDGGPDAGDCPTTCKSRHSAAVADFEAWDTCVATRCPTECNL